MLNFYILTSRNKIFALIITSALLILIISHVVYFEQFARAILKNDFSAKQFEYVKNNGDRIKVAAIGNSHTGDAISNDFDYFFNYGRMDTWYPQVAYAKFLHLLKFAPNLKVILLEVDHTAVLRYNYKTYTFTPNNHLYLLNHVHASLYDDNKTTDTNIEKVPFLISLQPSVAPVIHRKFIQNYLIERGKGRENKNVSHWINLTDKEKIATAKRRAHKDNLDSSITIGIDKAVRDYYNKAITKSREQGIKVYLVFYPQTEEYLAAISRENNIKIDDFVSSLAVQDNVTVLDYRHYFESNESFFENQDHLNEKGSKVLTEEIIKVIQNDL